MLLDIALVTHTLLNLIKQHVMASLEAPKVSPLIVSALPPDKLSGDHAIGLYLYYIAEDAHYKNLPPPSGELPPIRYTPMGLNLYYQLTAHSNMPDTDFTGASTENEQTMIGLAMKALRDYPVIDDTTEVGGAKVFPTALQETENRFRLVLHPLQHHEAMTYWTTGSQPLRLAVYYQVSVVLLEPEQPRSRFGRVLTYNVFSFVRGAPHLDGSRSTVTFTMPDETTPRQVEVQPAEAPISGKVTFFGSDLAGDQTTLLLKNRRFANPIEVGTDWGVVAREGEIFATVQPHVGLMTTVPGMYSAIAKVTERRLMPDKTLRDFTKTSNETPFVITPRITAILPPDASRTVVVQGGIFQDATGIAPEAVEVFVGPQRVPPRAGATLNPGEFEVVDANTLRFRYPIAGLSPGAEVPFRLIINGAESAPHWVTVR
jgi:hypothetical protein